MISKRYSPDVASEFHFLSYRTLPRPIDGSSSSSSSSSSSACQDQMVLMRTCRSEKL